MIVSQYLTLFDDSSSLHVPFICPFTGSINDWSIHRVTFGSRAVQGDLQDAPLRFLLLPCRGPGPQEVRSHRLEHRRSVAGGNHRCGVGAAKTGAKMVLKAS